MAMTLKLTADWPRLHTPFGMVRLEFAHYEFNRGSALEAEIVVRLFGRHGSAGQICFYQLRRDEQVALYTIATEPSRRKKIPECIETHARPAVVEYLRDNPDWLKGQLRRDIERSRDCLPHFPLLSNVKYHVMQIRCCAEWSETYREPVLGKSPAEWSRILQSVEEFEAAIAEAVTNGKGHVNGLANGAAAHA